LNPLIVDASSRSLSELPRFFQRFKQIRGEFVIYDDGFRGWTFTYPEIARLAERFAARLRSQGIQKGDAVAIWSESRPGWITVLWGCWIEGVVAVPVEPQSSLELFQKIQQKVHPRLILLGERVQNPAAVIPGVAALRISEIEQGGDDSTPESRPAVYQDDIAEIVFTSGTTAEPKGVVITHRNLAAQIAPIEDQLAPYRKYVRPFFPLRILNLLPMSHLFGQSMATFVPPLIPASVLFISATSPREIVRQIRSRRVCMLVAVPKVLEVLRGLLVRRFPETADLSGADRPWPLRWWRFRRVHWMFGWKFCCVVSGGAPLPADLETFWANLAIVVVQGYGLTETAPVVSFNHPFHVEHGTTGKPLAGVDVKIAEDGEVLVRGANVTPGYFQAPRETAAVFEDGWFHTGDYGELDAHGNLIIRGRKKEMIVTPEGLNVFPDDIEAALNRIPGVRESAVVGTDRVHAVLALEPGANADEIVRQANAQLESHQKIRDVSIWKGRELPRTKTTGKLRRAQIASELQAQAAPPGAPSVPSRDQRERSTTGGAEGQMDDLASVVQKYAPGRTVTGDTTIDELGLGSLDRVQIMMELEEKFGASIDESAFASATKVADLADLANVTGTAEEPRFPSYNRTWIARLIRAIALEAIILPFTRFYGKCKISGLDHLESVRGPAVFASNHQSYFDTAVILASLPRKWRRRIAPAMWKEYFELHFHPEQHPFRERWANSVLYWLVTLLFNAFPVPQSEKGVRESVRYIGELVEQGWSILIFPEGGRYRDMQPFFPGVGLIASRLHLPVIPIRLSGTGEVLPPDARWPRRPPSPARQDGVSGRVEVKMGPAIFARDESFADLARRIEQAVRVLA
jgi:long-chain acyl-CoA synthetase